jgi:3-oxoadipate enol-lactonase
MPRIDVDGVAINYQDTGGDGVPLVLVHGWPLSSQMWVAQIEAVAPRRVIAPDLMGFGASDAPDDPSAYSMDVFARQVLAVIDAAGGGPVVLGGLSMGGYVCFAVFRAAPDEIAALVLADTRAEGDTPETSEKRVAQQAQVRSEGTEGLISELLVSLPAPAAVASNPHLVLHLKALMRNPAAGIVGGLEAMKARPDSRPLLESIHVPVLVIAGEEDSVTPLDGARRLEESIETAELVVIPGAGHLSNLERPDPFNGALTAFLTRL